MRENHGTNGIAKELPEIISESALLSHTRRGGVPHIHRDQLRRDVHGRYASACQNHHYDRRKLSCRFTLRERRVFLALGQVKRSRMNTNK